MLRLYAVCHEEVTHEFQPRHSDRWIGVRTHLEQTSCQGQASCDASVCRHRLPQENHSLHSVRAVVQVELHNLFEEQSVEAVWRDIPLGEEETIQKAEDGHSCGICTDGVAHLKESVDGLHLQRRLGSAVFLHVREHSLNSIDQCTHHLVVIIEQLSLLFWTTRLVPLRSIVRPSHLLSPHASHLHCLVPFYLLGWLTLRCQETFQLRHKDLHQLRSQGYLTPSQFHLR
mmetsp:Transcript_40148/g.92264  ORF Transcript_40148/g.92264 Transcript_40148/m.92264 type:complete len:229 (-) Transcript_40148:1103-1789(-)